MRIVEGRAEGLRITYIGGGSRGWAWQLMGDLAMEPNLSGTVALYDIDHNAAQVNAVIGNRLSRQEGVRGQWDYLACDSLAEAVTDADFVIISILPGTFDEMQSDVHAPEAYGVYQSVGDTSGPGGLVRALRTGPMFQAIAKAIATHAPHAFVINYTNPMAQCIRVLYDTYPGIRAIGCCHEVFGTQRLLCKALKEIAGMDGIERSQLRTTVTGVNHFTFITQASYRGMDLFPLYRTFAQRYWKTGFVEGDDSNWMNRYFDSAHRVKFDMFLRYGAIAAAGDRHLAEFNPGPRYLKDPDTAHSWRFTLTPVAWRKADLKERLAKSHRLYTGEEAFPIKGSGEEGVQMIRALCGLGDMVTNVNVPNRGQVSNVPLGAVMETNAVLSGAGIAPVLAGDMPPALLALSMPAITAQSLIMDAIRERKASLALPAFVNDPLTCTLSPRDAVALCQQMLSNTAGYLEGWDLAL